jgi:membrane fusion protein (multidrug efflux system)
MFARVSLELARRSGALVVPEEAIVPQSEGAIVFKLVAAADGSSLAQRVPVVLGLRGDGFVEVTQGLAVGDVVVTAGQQRLQKDATRVRVADAAARPAERAASR